MRCRSCGTEIADKAIVCYRCGAGTTDPVRKPVPIRATRGWPPLLAVILPLLAALVLMLLSETSGYPKAMATAAGLLAALGALLLIARLLRRR